MRRIISITILVFAFCFGVFAQTTVISSCAGLPLKIADYGKVNRNIERAQLDLLVNYLQDVNNKDSKGVIFLNFDKKYSTESITNRLKNIYNDLFIIRKVDKTQIEFVISKSDEYRTELQLLPIDFEITCEDCLVIKAKDFEKMKNLFQPKPIIKNRKK